MHEAEHAKHDEEDGNDRVEREENVARREEQHDERNREADGQALVEAEQ